MTSLNLFVFRTRKENNGEGTAWPDVHYLLSNARIRQVVCQYFTSRMHSSVGKFPSLTQQLTTCQVGNYANVYQVSEKGLPWKANLLQSAVHCVDQSDQSEFLNLHNELKTCSLSPF